MRASWWWRWTRRSSRSRSCNWRRSTFPSCRSWRARDVTHWHALRDLGVEHVEREVFESSLRTARTVLELNGLSPQEADTLAERFRAHNIALSTRMYEHHNDREAMIAVAKH